MHNVKVYNEWSFNTITYCKVISTIELIQYSSPPSLLCMLWENLQSILSDFKLFNTVFLTIEEQPHFSSKKTLSTPIIFSALWREAKNEK